jgi:hypothetical protein
MVTSNQEGIEGKEGVIAVRVGGIIIIIINPRIILSMIDQKIMLVRERNKSGR